MENLKTNNRIMWIDGIKLLAIIAVVVDHCNGIMYTNKYISTASYFSVTTFVIISGISTFYSYNRSLVILPFWENAKKQYPFIKSYAVAVFILSVYYLKFFDLNIYISNLLNFNIQGPFYFVLFFLQLKLITPFLLRWLSFCNKMRIAWLWHLVSLFTILCLSSVLINYTLMLPVHGGGKYLFGGTYLFVYYLGILIANSGILMRINKVLCCFCCAPIILFWVWGMSNNKLTIDASLRSFFGDGFNPPSFNFIVYSLLIVLFFYSFFELLACLKTKVLKKVFSLISFLGKNSLYIFMYHLLIRDLFPTIFPTFFTNLWFLRLVVFPCMIILPPTIKFCFSKVYKKTINSLVPNE